MVATAAAAKAAPRKQKLELREVDLRAIDLLDAILFEVYDELGYAVTNTSRGLRKRVAKAITTLADLRGRTVAREYPVAAAQKSYRCPKCGVNVSPVCFNCGNDPRTG